MPLQYSMPPDYGVDGGMSAASFYRGLPNPSAFACAVIGVNLLGSELIQVLPPPRCRLLSYL